MIGSRQAIAIFKDDVLHATSIVAMRPPESPGAGDPAAQVEQAKIMEAVFAN
jgi:hypothetical protein